VKGPISIANGEIATSINRARRRRADVQLSPVVRRRRDPCSSLTSSGDEHIHNTPWLPSSTVSARPLPALYCHCHILGDDGQKLQSTRRGPRNPRLRANACYLPLNAMLNYPCAGGWSQRRRIALPARARWRWLDGTICIVARAQWGTRLARVGHARNLKQVPELRRLAALCSEQLATRGSRPRLRPPRSRLPALSSRTRAASRFEPAD